MESKVKSIRTFIGAKNYQISRNFYRDVGFQEVVLSPDMSYFSMEGLGFYLQNAYVKDWVNNSMIFMEVVDLQKFWAHLVALNLDEKYKNVRLLPIRELDWGKECFLHDPSGILWHFGTFNIQ
jgi:hypothetical protein